MAEDILVNNENGPCSNWRDAVLRGLAAREAEQRTRPEQVDRFEESVPAGEDGVHGEPR
jgi:hypothetical protein